MPHSSQGYSCYQQEPSCPQDPVCGSISVKAAPAVHTQEQRSVRALKQGSVEEKRPLPVVLLIPRAGLWISTSKWFLTRRSLGKGVVSIPGLQQCSGTEIYRNSSSHARDTNAGQRAPGKAAQSLQGRSSYLGVHNKIHQSTVFHVHSTHLRLADQQYETRLVLRCRYHMNVFDSTLMELQRELSDKQRVSSKRKADKRCGLARKGGTTLIEQPGSQNKWH